MAKEFSTYGSRLTYAMALRKLERKDLAVLVDATPQIVGTWMKAETAPKGRSPHRVASALRLDPAWLIHGDGPEPGYAQEEPPESMVREAQIGFSALEEAFPDVDPLVMGQAMQVILLTTNRLKITLEEERLGRILFSVIRRAQTSGEKPSEQWVIEAILNP